MGIKTLSKKANESVHSKARRYNYIDSLRGLAAVSVIWYHILEFGTPHNAVDRLARWLLFDQIDLGKVAVIVFFGVSGYVIPYSLLRPSSHPLRDFVISRFFRLYPVYWVSIFCGAILLYVIPGKSLPFHVVALNITMLQQFFGAENIIGVYWTLQIELIFYFFCAAMFFFGVFRRPKVIVAWVWLMLGFAALLAVLRYKTGKSLPVALPLSLSVMYFGYIWRSYTLLGESRLKPYVLSMIIGFIVLLPIISEFAYGDEALQYTLTYYIALGCFILGTTSRKLNWSATAYLGKISYSLYLFGSLWSVVASYLSYQIFGYGNIEFVIITATAFSIVFSSLTYKLVEAPSIACGRAISQSWSGRLVGLTPSV
jgi:peptidoglycan/LPS O-acetylase OafA/YrhL